MTLTIELTAEAEHRLRQEAERNGMSPSDYARHLIMRSLPLQPAAGESLWETLTPDEWIRETRQWSESHRDWPILPPGADDRASFYEERE